MEPSFTVRKTKDGAVGAQGRAPVLQKQKHRIELEQYRTVQFKATTIKKKESTGRKSNSSEMKAWNTALTVEKREVMIKLCWHRNGRRGQRFAGVETGAKNRASLVEKRDRAEVHWFIKGRA